MKTLGAMALLGMVLYGSGVHTPHDLVAFAMSSIHEIIGYAHQAFTTLPGLSGHINGCLQSFASKACTGGR